MNQFDQFFEYYGRVLSEGDLSGIADCYTVPGLVLGDENNIAIADLKEVEKSFAGAAEYYRSQGMVSIHSSVINTSTLTHHLSLVEVRWDYRNESGQSVQQTYYHYLLRSAPDGKLKIQIVIAHPEA